VGDEGSPARAAAEMSRPRGLDTGTSNEACRDTIRPRGSIIGGRLASDAIVWVRGRCRGAIRAEANVLLEGSRNNARKFKFGVKCSVESTNASISPSSCRSCALSCTVIERYRPTEMTT
jgi:hypothetical protein